MKTLAIFLAMINFLTGSLNDIKSNLSEVLGSTQLYPLQAMTLQLIKPEPVRDPFYLDPVIEATSAIVMDAETKKILFGKNPHQRLAMASITKIMTAMVVLRHTNDLQKTIRVSETASEINGSQMYLLANETMTTENLLKGALIESANDAAYALAEGLYGNVTRFVDAMNNYAKELELKDTHFTNSYGADDATHYSTAYDIAQLTAHALQNPTFRSIVSLKQATVKDVTGRLTHQLENTNKLVGQYLNVIGVKTGTTLEAGASLVAAAEGDSQQTVVVVLLNSPQRFTEAKTLLDWSLKAYNWIEPL